MTILTPFVHMEKAWSTRRPDGRGELSLQGSDCKMSHEFDFCVIQAFVIIYLCLRVFVWLHSEMGLLHVWVCVDL